MNLCQTASTNPHQSRDITNLICIPATRLVKVCPTSATHRLDSSILNWKFTTFIYKEVMYPKLTLCHYSEWSCLAIGQIGKTLIFSYSSFKSFGWFYGMSILLGLFYSKVFFQTIKVSNNFFLNNNTVIFGEHALVYNYYQLKFGQWNSEKKFIFKYLVDNMHWLLRQLNLAVVQLFNWFRETKNKNYMDIFTQKFTLGKTNYKQTRVPRVI